MIKDRKIKILIRRYAKAIGIQPIRQKNFFLSPEAIVTRTFLKEDLQGKKQMLIAMRATLFAKKHVKPGTSYEEQQKIMDEFTKSENLTDVKWPEIKIEEEKLSVTG